jgi:hypothetical protein
MLSPADAVIISMIIKLILDLLEVRTGKKVSIDDLAKIIDDEEVRRIVLAAQREKLIPPEV